MVDAKDGLMGERIGLKPACIGNDINNAVILCEFAVLTYWINSLSS